MSRPSTTVVGTRCDSLLSSAAAMAPLRPASAEAEATTVMNVRTLPFGIIESSIATPGITPWKTQWYSMPMSKIGRAALMQQLNEKPTRKIPMKTVRSIPMA